MVFTLEPFCRGFGDGAEVVDHMHSDLGCGPRSSWGSARSRAKVRGMVESCPESEVEICPGTRAWAPASFAMRAGAKIYPDTRAGAHKRTRAQAVARLSPGIEAGAWFKGSVADPVLGTHPLGYYAKGV